MLSRFESCYVIGCIMGAAAGVVVVGDDHSVEGKNNSQHRA